jgi:hypothetical protein
MKSGVETVWPTPWRQSILRHAAAVSIVLAQTVADHRTDQSLKRLPKSADPRRGPAQPRNAAQHRARQSYSIVAAKLARTTLAQWNRDVALTFNVRLPTTKRNSRWTRNM